MVQSSTKTLRMPPVHSLPSTTPPWPSCITQRRMTKFSLGTLTRRPSLLRPDLIAMQSSPVSNTQSSISTSREDSGSQPSLFGPWRVDLHAAHGDVLREHRMDLPHRRADDGHALDQDVLAAVGLDEIRPQEAARAEDALATGTPASPMLVEPVARRPFCLPGRLRDLLFQPHQVSSAWPSSVPSPVTAMFSCSKA
jgi:hypothetical protein